MVEPHVKPHVWSPMWSPPVEVCTAVLVDSLLYTAVPVHEYSYSRIQLYRSDDPF